MATVNLSSGTNVRRWEGPHQTPDFVLTNKLDFSRNNAGSSDVVQALLVPAKCFIREVRHILLVAEGGTSTCTVGDGDDADGWIVGAINQNATANTVWISDSRPVLSAGTPNTFASFVNAYHGGKYYESSDTIDLTLSAHALDTAVVLMVAEGFDMTLYD